MKHLLRFNFIRNHYLRFGLYGVLFYFTLLLRNRKYIVFNSKEFKNKIYLRKESSDIDVFYQTIFNNQYNVALKNTPKVIIDLGANTGISSVYFLNKYPKSLVIAVEPEKSNYEMLLKNTSGYENFYCYNNGIWNKNAHLLIEDNYIGTWGFSVQEISKINEKSVEALTLNEIIEKHSLTQIDLLKIDIEGSEIELFSDNYEKWLSITKTIVIELHDWMRKGCSKQFFTTLINYDFEISVMGENIICFLNH